jgi:hypothetical protein
MHLGWKAHICLHNFESSHFRRPRSTYEANIKVVHIYMYVYIYIYTWLLRIVCAWDSLKPPLWPNGQSSWPQIQRSGFDSWRYQILWEVVGVERGPLNLVNTIEELLGRKSWGSGLESRDYGRRASASLTTQKLSLTSPTSGSRSVCIFRSQTLAKEFVVCFVWDGLWM